MQKKYPVKSSFLYSAVLLMALFAGIYGCTKKSDGIDNNTIVEAPYSLYFADSAGAVYTSNDGKAFTNIMEADGYPVRAICSQYTNLFVIKNFLYVSSNNGLNFSLGNKSIYSLTSTDCNNIPIGLNESMIINIPNWYRVYVACNDPSGANALGQTLSVSGGEYGSWNSFDAITDTFPGGVGNLAVHMMSYTRLTCGTVCGLALDQFSTPSAFIYRNFYKTDTPTADRWEEVTAYSAANYVYDLQCYAPRITGGIPLPNNGFFTLGHFNNRLMAIDSKCANGAYYSDDTGKTWLQYPGLPANTSLLSICSPFESSCLIGSANGLYSLDVNTGSFELISGGLTDGIRVNGITYKENVMKSGPPQQFVYLATNKGIYKSTDGGNNYIMTIPGNYTTIY